MKKPKEKEVIFIPEFLRIASVIFVAIFIIGTIVSIIFGIVGYLKGKP